MDIVDIDHIAIRVTDLEQSLDFYSDLLGLPTRDRDRFDNGEVPYVGVVAGGRHIHVVPVEQDEIEVGGEHVCFLIRSKDVNARTQLEELMELFREHGIHIEKEEPRKRYGAYGRAWAVYVRDPDGRRVELKIH